MGLPRILLYVVGRVMAALIAGLGLAWDYTGESVLTVSPSNWGIIGLIAFGAFALITLFREIDLAIQQKPNIVVEPKVRENRAILEVQNIGGGEASFTAKARVVATVPQPELYIMYWESVNSISCHIDGDGGIAPILVGEVAKRDYITGDATTSIFKGGLALFKMGTSGEQTFPVFSGERTERIRNGKKVISGRPIARCIVEITITATPRLKKKWGTHKYMVEVDEEDRELKFYETDLSVPHKLSCQT